MNIKRRLKAPNKQREMMDLEANEFYQLPFNSISIDEEKYQDFMGTYHRGFVASLKKRIFIRELSHWMFSAKRLKNPNYSLRNKLKLKEKDLPNLYFINGYSIEEKSEGEYSKFFLFYEPHIYSTLHSQLKFLLRTPLELKYNMLLELCRTLEKIHSEKLSYKALSPDSILVSEDFSVVYIFDWGMAVDLVDENCIPNSYSPLNPRPSSWYPARNKEATIEEIQAGDVYAFAHLVFLVLTGSEFASQTKGKKEVFRSTEFALITPGLFRKCMNSEFNQRPTMKFILGKMEIVKVAIDKEVSKGQKKFRLPEKVICQQIAEENFWELLNNYEKVKLCALAYLVLRFSLSHSGF